MPGFTFNSVLLGPSLVSGVAQAGLYGLLAVALVLAFRVSRTVAFVLGGLAIVGAMGYWWLSFDAPSYLGPQPNLPRLVAVGVVILFGGAFGLLYGLVVTGRRMADWPKITLTTFSLGIMLLMSGVVTVAFV